MCPECESVSSTTFIGKASRYLAIQSRTDLVLWDLVTDDVQWQYQSLSTISQVFSHHREESFVVLESDARTSQTYVSKFTPSSSSPTSSHTLPFSLISTAPCPPRWLLSNDPSSFAFVGITHTWSAVIFGDHIRLAEGEETSARGLAGAASVTTQTLFQDIFGRSAFTDLSARNANVAVPAFQGSAWKGKEVERIFDTPAYLLPPLGSLFDPLMDEFLTPRTDADAAPSSGANKYAERQDVDVDMEGVEGPILVGNRLERVIDQHEMATMIELFKHHGLQSALPEAPTPKRPVQIHGHHKSSSGPNGLSNGVVKPNGTTPRTLHHTPSVASVDIKNPSPKQASSPAVKVGQKRKKSLE